MTDLLSLKWNNHQAQFAGILSHLRAKEIYVDATLVCGGNLYPAHKFVLSTCSDYFKQLFEQIPNKDPIIVMKDVTQNDLEALLDFMYEGEVSVPQKRLGLLIKTAESLQIKGLAIPDEPSIQNAKKSAMQKRGREVSPTVEKRSMHHRPHKRRATTSAQDGTDKTANNVNDDNAVLEMEDNHTKENSLAKEPMEAENQTMNNNEDTKVVIKTEVSDIKGWCDDESIPELNSDTLSATESSSQNFRQMMDPTDQDISNNAAENSLNIKIASVASSAPNPNNMVIKGIGAPDNHQTRKIDCPDPDLMFCSIGLCDDNCDITSTTPEHLARKDAKTDKIKYKPQNIGKPNSGEYETRNDPLLQSEITLPCDKKRHFTCRKHSAEIPQKSISNDRKIKKKSVVVKEGEKKLKSIPPISIKRPNTMTSMHKPIAIKHCSFCNKTYKLDAGSVHHCY